MEISEANTIFCEAVDVGRFDLAAECSHIGKAQIIGNDDEEVRPFTLNRRRHGSG